MVSLLAPLATGEYRAIASVAPGSADEWDKARGSQPPFFGEAAVMLSKRNDDLGAAAPDWLDEPAVVIKLINERRWHAWRRS